MVRIISNKLNIEYGIQETDGQMINDELKMVNPEFLRRSYLKKQTQFVNGQNDVMCLYERCL